VVHQTAVAPERDRPADEFPRVFFKLGAVRKRSLISPRLRADEDFPHLVGPSFLRACELLALQLSASIVLPAVLVAFLNWA
jgi:hypothetical protein